MLYDSSCKHLEGLQSIMSGCDALILENLPPELSKLTGRIVKRWWTEHGLPEAASHFCKEPKATMCCDASVLYADIHLTCVFLVS
jgi:hypothetical protein